MPTLVRFGVFEANLETGELWKNGTRLKLQDQPFRVLAMLLDRPGDIVSREQLQTALWPGAEFGEFEQGLNTAVRKVRQVLGDEAQNPRFVETLPRKGYRFIAPLHLPEATAPPAIPPSAAPRDVKRRLIAIVGTGAVLLGAGLWLALRPTPLPPPPAAADSLPLTTMPGIERGPSFSPNGEQVAFSWNGASRDNFDIYVKPVNAETLTRLTRAPESDYGAAWSPDGRQIAFIRELPNARNGVFLVPASGGPEVKIADTYREGNRPFHPIVAWTPDSKWLALSDRIERGAGPGIYLLSVVTGERRRLTTVPNDARSDIAPAFSWDGKWLAFLRDVTIARNDLYRLPLGADFQPAGPPVALVTEGVEGIASFAWMPDNRRILASNGWGYGADKNNGLWMVDTSAGKQPPVYLKGAEKTATTLTVSRHGDIAYATGQTDANIWRVHLDARHKPSDTPAPFIASTAIDIVPKFSPDGQRVVFVSRRSGDDEVWTANADGSNPVQVTNIGRNGSPGWSPDGRHIVFDSLRDGQYEVYSVLATGGPPRRLTNHPAVDSVASYSPDGAFIYFCSLRTGRPEIWRMKADGSEQVQITKNGGYLARVSADGQTLYYFHNHTVRRMPMAGGSDELVLPSINGFLNFTLTPDAIYYIPRAKPGTGAYAIRRYDLATQADDEVVDISNPQRFTSEVNPDHYLVNVNHGLTVSPDGKTLLWARTDQGGSDLRLIRR